MSYPEFVNCVYWNVGMWESYAKIDMSEEVLQQSKQEILDQIDHDCMCFVGTDEKIIRLLPNKIVDQNGKVRASERVYAYRKVGNYIWVWDEQKFVSHALLIKENTSISQLFLRDRLERVFGLAMLILDFSQIEENPFEEFTKNKQQWLKLGDCVGSQEKLYRGQAYHRGGSCFASLLNNKAEFQRFFLQQPEFNDSGFDAVGLLDPSSEGIQQQIIQLRNTQYLTTAFFSLNFFYRESILYKKFASDIFPCVFQQEEGKTEIDFDEAGQERRTETFPSITETSLVKVLGVECPSKRNIWLRDPTSSEVKALKCLQQAPRIEEERLRELNLFQKIKSLFRF